VQRIVIAVPVCAVALVAAAPAYAHHATDNPWTRALLGQDALPFAVPAGGMTAGLRADTRHTGAATPQAVGDCGPDALPETGLQGQVPRADQDSGRSKLGYRCNVRLVGSNEIESRGANFSLAWYRDCAYVGLVGTRDSQEPAEPPNDRLEGFAVLDASDAAHPRLVDIVRSPVGRSQHEAIEVNERRGVLVVEIGGIVARWVEVYDVSQDCTRPVFKGRYDAGAPIFHGLRISDDGMTVYASDTFGATGAGQILHVLDISDLTNPRLIVSWDPQEETPPGRYGIHDLDVSPDGTRAYLGTGPPSALPGVFGFGSPSRFEGPSLVVLDTSDVQARKPNPDLRVVSELELPNFGHTVQRTRIDGVPHLIVSGETPFVGGRNCPWSWGHVLDMRDERRPLEVAELKLEVNQQENCERVADDEAGYSIHYIGVDSELETTKLFYSYYTAGLRVFDVRDPTAPREIAYYHPPPKESVILPAVSSEGGDLQKPEWDSVPSMVRYRPETGQLWFVAIGGGFEVAELTGVATPVRGSARVAGRRVDRRGRLAVRVSCAAPCVLEVGLRVGGRRAARRTVRFRSAGRRTLRLALDRRARALLARRPGRRVQVVAVVRDPATGRVLQSLRSRPRSLSRR
jgi:hypothetical protein